MKALTPNMLNILEHLAKSGVHVTYMPYMGRFQQHPYWFISDDHSRCTAAAEGLKSRGLLVVTKDDWRSSHAEINALGRKVLDDARPKRP